MTALTAAYDARRKDGQLVSHPVAAATKIYKGALVQVTTATGLVSPCGDNAGVVFAGVAYETVDNSTGAAGALSIRIQKEGLYVYNKAAAVQSDVGKPALATDDNTVSTAATTNNVGVGFVEILIDATHVGVKIDNKAT